MLCAARLRVCVAALLLGCALAQAATPKFKWGQDDLRLHITVDVHCSTDRKVAFTVDTFSLTCTDKAGTPYALEFVLREDIKPEESSCKPHPRKGEECHIVKDFPHMFDRLVAESGALSRFMSMDWEQYDDNGDRLDPVDHYDDAKFVRELTGETLDKAIAAKDVVVVDGELPYCVKCLNRKVAFKKAAKQLKGKVLFGWVDTLEDRALRRTLRAGCDGHDCRLAVFKKSTPAGPIFIEAPEKEEDLVKALEAHLGELFTEVPDAAALSAFVGAHPVAAVGFFAARSGPEYEAFVAGCNAVCGSMACGLAIGSAAGQEGAPTPSVRVFRNHSVEGPETLTAFGDGFPAILKACVEAPLLAFDWKLHNEFKDRQEAIGSVFLDGASDGFAEAEAMFTRLATEFRGRLVFLLYKTADYPYVLSDFGLSETIKHPQFGIASSLAYEGVTRYGLLEEATEAGVRAHIQSYLAGTLKPTVKSGLVPETPWAAGAVKTVVALTFDADVRNASDDVFLILYRTWSEGWDKKNATIDKVALTLESVPGVVVAKYNLENNFFDKEYFEGLDENELHALFIATRDGERTLTPYTGKFTRKAVTDFLKRRSPAVKANWATVTVAIKKIIADFKAKKAAAEEAKRKAAEALDGLERVKITDDGGITKQVQAEGEGASPTTGAQVKAHYTGTLLDGTVFDSSRERGDPFSFELGKGQVIPCWDKGFETMKVGERAYLECTADYAYGERGSPPKIPGGATLRFDVELLSFTGGEARDPSDL